MSQTLSSVVEGFEQLKKVAPNGEEYWMGRDLQVALGYTEWRNFDNVIQKGKTACKESNIEPKYHFVEVNKVIDAGKGARGERGDWYLTRYACYLTAMNGYPSKQEVAAAQTYFAVQSRRQELSDLSVAADPDGERIEMRQRVLTNHKTLMGVAKSIGVGQFNFFNNEGYKGLYNMGIPDLKKLKRIPVKDTILDYAGRAELAAHDFRITQTEGKIKTEQIKGQRAAEQAHYKVGKEVREAIKRVGGTMPENLPAETHIKKVVSARKKAAKLAEKAGKGLLNEGQ